MSNYQLTICPHCNGLFARVRVVMFSQKPVDGYVGEQPYRFEECDRCKREMEAFGLLLAVVALAAYRPERGET